MTWSLDEFLDDVPLRNGNGGRVLSPTDPRAVEAPMTPIDKTTAAAKLIIDDEAQKRASRTARLKADRKARDVGKPT